MTAQPSPAADTGACPLCGAAVAPADERCPECNSTLAGTAGHAPLYSRAALWWTIAAFLAIYLVTIAIVAATR